MTGCPEVSIVMGVYRPGTQELCQSVRSALNQTLQKIELILVRDDERPETLALLQELQREDSRIVLLDNGRNRGLIYSLNRGLQVAKGALIARLDVGDWWQPDKLEKQRAAFHKEPSLIIVGTQVTMVTPGGNTSYRLPSDDWEIRAALLQGRNPFAHPSVMFRNLPGVGYSPAALHTEDFELWCRLFLLGTMRNLNEPLTFYRLDENGITGSKRYLMYRNATKVYCHFLHMLCNSRKVRTLPAPYPVIPETSMTPSQHAASRLATKASHFAILRDSRNAKIYTFLAVLRAPGFLFAHLQRTLCRLFYRAADISSPTGKLHHAV